MGKIIPERTVEVLRSFNDLAVDIYGIECDLYVPSNLNDVEGYDAYLTFEDIQYTKYEGITSWIEWHAKDIAKLRKLGMFTEDEAPITAYFRNDIPATIKSYIEVDVRFAQDVYHTDKFELVGVIMKNTYDSEVFQRFKLAPLRRKE